jgi:hypothetical protein
MDVAAAGSSASSQRVWSRRIAWPPSMLPVPKRARPLSSWAKVGAGRTAPESPQQDFLVARIVQLDFRAQHVHRELFQNHGQDVARQHQQEIIALAPDQQQGQQASLGGAKAGEARTVGLDAADVVGQQVVQENGGIDTADTDQTEIGQGCHDGAVACREQFVGSAAEAAAVRCQALGSKEGIPFLSHEVIRVGGFEML